MFICPGSAASTFAFRHRSNAASAWPCLNKVVSLLSISSNSPASSTCSKRSFAFSIRLSVSTAKALMMRSATAGVACCILAIVSASMASKLSSTTLRAPGLGGEQVLGQRLQPDGAARPGEARVGRPVRAVPACRRWLVVQPWCSHCCVPGRGGQAS